MAITADDIWNEYAARTRTPSGYNTALEWCGHPQRRHVVRYNGEWRESFSTKREALEYINTNGGKP